MLGIGGISGARREDWTSCILGLGGISGARREVW